MEIEQEYSQTEWKIMFLEGIDSSVSEAKNEMKLFKEYLQEGEVVDHPEKHNDMEIMFFLYKLGYRPQDLGTFFYKEIVKKITILKYMLFLNIILKMKLGRWHNANY